MTIDADTLATVKEQAVHQFIFAIAQRMQAPDDALWRSLYEQLLRLVKGTPAETTLTNGWSARIDELMLERWQVVFTQALIDEAGAKKTLGIYAVEPTPYMMDSGTISQKDLDYQVIKQKMAAATGFCTDKKSYGME